MHESLFEVNGINKDVIIITFGGCAMKAYGIPPFEFLNSLTKWFPQFDKKFYIDIEQCWYNKGIRGISKNIDETRTYLKEVIKEYKKVVFIGTSAGGYAAILFGSLLNISNVIAFAPQSVLTRSDIDNKYRNLKCFINNSTQYLIYGDLSITDESNPHNISHVNNLVNFLNVKIVYKNGLSLVGMRDNGELQQILESIIID